MLTDCRDWFVLVINMLDLWEYFASIHLFFSGFKYNIVYVCVLQTRKLPVEDLFSDLCDGRRLLELLEGLAGHELV